MYSEVILSELPEEPHQPVLNFPKRSFGQKKPVHCSFQGKWFSKWRWLHYDEGKDAVFCYICVTALKQRKIKYSHNAATAFVSWDYYRWLAIAF